MFQEIGASQWPGTSETWLQGASGATLGRLAVGRHKKSGLSELGTGKSVDANVDGGGRKIDLARVYLEGLKS